MVARGIQAAGGGIDYDSCSYSPSADKSTTYVPIQPVQTDSGHSHDQPFTDDKSWSGDATTEIQNSPFISRFFWSELSWSLAKLVKIFGEARLQGNVIPRSRSILLWLYNKIYPSPPKSLPPSTSRFRSTCPPRAAKASQECHIHHGFRLRLRQSPTLSINLSPASASDRDPATSDRYPATSATHKP
jgi:hypothetical protein